jgi:putative ABC transport system permease protein
MLRNYFVTAVRNLIAQPLYSAINIGGLALGLAACLLILLFVRDELSYDEWLPHADRIAKLKITFSIPGREAMTFSQSPGPAKAALEKDFGSDIERMVRVFQTEQPVRIGDRQFADKVSYVDPGFFEVFDLPAAQGDRDAALAAGGRLLVSERIARKYFGDAAPVGRVVTIDRENDYTVVGVLRDVPANSHLALDMVALFEPRQYAKYPAIAELWTSANMHTYALFRSEQAIARVQASLPAFTDRNVPLDVPGFQGARVSSLLQFDFIPVRDIHLRLKTPGEFKPGGDIAAVVAFAAIAGLILVIACINFVNLATARSMKRAREVALRKVVGATRGQLVAQHLGEAVLTALVALVLAAALVELALAPFGEFVGKQLSLDPLGDPFLLLVAAGLVAAVGLLGGLYPAIYLSRFRPARVLKANQSSAGGSPRFRSALVVFQFAVSISLIVSTAVVYGQTIYGRTIDLGFASRDKLVVHALQDMPSAELQQALAAQVRTLPGVRAASLSSDSPPLQDSNNTILFPRPVVGDDKLLIETLEVDTEFFRAYHVEPLAGRVFSREFPGDARRIPDGPGQGSQGIVVNQMLLSKLGFASPEAAVGQVVWDVANPVENSGPPRLVRSTIVGVVPDMHLRSLRVEVTPLLYRTHGEPYASGYGELTVDVEPGRMSEVREAVAGVWQRLVPSAPLRTGHVDDEVAALYDAEEQRAQTFAAFAAFAVVIACLGLFGLASFAAERRTKEIGMRKVLGASVLDIVRLLVWQFSRPVLVANLLAWPAAFYFMSRWLSGFRYAIDLTSPLVLIGVFGGAGLVALIIAWSTVAGHATRVARSSPIHALRCE